MTRGLMYMLGAALLTLAVACGGRTPANPGDDDDDNATPTPTPQINVGDVRSFWSWDFSGGVPPSEVQIPATARAIGKSSYVFVEDALWANGTVTPDMLAPFLTALDSTTPVDSINPNQGIFDNNTDVFGPIPNTHDGDPRMFLLLMDIKPNGNFNFNGFFRSVDQMTDADAVAQQGYHSNEVEMLHINAERRPVSDPITHSILAHELEHLIEYGHDTFEESWLKEAMAQSAMTINGYYTDGPDVVDYINDTTQPLKAQPPVHYGACLLYGNYLLEQYGTDILGDIVSRAADGDFAVADALAAANAGIDANGLFTQWATANGLNAPGTPLGYSFATIPDIVPAGSYYASGDPGPFALNVNGSSANYFDVQSTSNVSISVSDTVGAYATITRYDINDRTIHDVQTFDLNAIGFVNTPIDLTGPYNRALITVVSTQLPRTFNVQFF